MTAFGNNDTFVANGAIGGVPGEGEIPMELISNQPFDDFLIIRKRICNTWGVEDK